MKTKVFTGLLAGSFFLNIACNSRKADSSTYMSGPDGATKEATATDRAETISAPTDSTKVIILSDSLKQENNAL